MIEAEKSFKARVFSSVIKQGGRLAPKGMAEARLKECEKCEYAGKVRPLPKLELRGCTLCGCPFITKPFMLEFLGNPTACPHPEGNKWEEVDTYFLE